MLRCASLPASRPTTRAWSGESGRRGRGGSGPQLLQTPNSPSSHRARGEEFGRREGTPGGKRAPLQVGRDVGEAGRELSLALGFPKAPHARGSGEKTWQGATFSPCPTRDTQGRRPGRYSDPVSEKSGGSGVSSASKSATSSSSRSHSSERGSTSMPAATPGGKSAPRRSLMEQRRASCRQGISGCGWLYFRPARRRAA